MLNYNYNHYNLLILDIMIIVVIKDEDMLKSTEKREAIS